MKKPAAELAHELLQQIGKIKLNDATTILGGSSGTAMLNKLRISAAKLQESLIKKQSYKIVMENYEIVAADIDTAGVIGLISEEEMVEYYTLVDSLWAAIEHEKA